MELVKGVPITEYADAANLTPKDRLALFVQVCQAVQHAHQKGVIHRDLKPSNVLVTSHDGVPVPKVIDFGVTKAIGQSLTEKTIYTRLAQMIGTPLYMSPEQAEMSGLDVDTRSDVYALGVLLYELLTGTTPFDGDRFRKAAFDEIRRIIKEEEPPRPSTRLTSLGATLTAVSAKRGTDPGRLAGLVRGELDWIVMRCLEKDRTRRYDTPTALAKDVQRYLTGDAVEACPPTLGYQLRKAYRRNRAVLTSAAVVAAALVVGIALAGWQAVRATNAEREIATERDKTAEQRDIALKAGKESIDERDKARTALSDLQTAQGKLRSTLYASEMNSVQQAWNANDLPRVHRLLDRQRPGPGESDLRGFEWHYRDRKCNPELSRLTLSESFGPLTTISPDGRYITTVATHDKAAVVKVLDATTGREVFSVPMPTAPPDPNAGSTVQPYLAFSASGARLMILWSLRAAQSSRLIVRSVPDNKPLLDKTDAYSNYALAVSDTRVALRLGSRVDGSKGPSDAALLVYRLDDGKEAFRRPAPFNSNAVAFSGDGKRLAVMKHPEARLPKDPKDFRPLPPNATSVHILDVSTGEDIGTLPNLPTFLQSIALNSDGSRLVGWRTSSIGAADPDPDGWVWDTKTGQRLAIVDGIRISASFQGDREPQLAFSPDDARIIFYSPRIARHPREVPHE